MLWSRTEKVWCEKEKESRGGYLQDRSEDGTCRVGSEVETDTDLLVGGEGLEWGRVFGQGWSSR